MWAWVMAMASASAASGPLAFEWGSRIFTIACTCSLSAWPTPTTDFFTWFGAYSATVEPCAGRHQQRDRAGLAELQRGDRVFVDERLFDGGGFGAEPLDNGEQALVQRDKAVGERHLTVRRHHAAFDEFEPGTVAFDHAPAGAAEAGIEP